MSEELQSFVQIIELYGRGLGALGKAIRFSAKGAAKGVDIAKVKAMQHKMKLHYASTGNHKTMRLSDLEKLTGGQYNILNIPLEEEKGLMGFYDRLKKLRVSFAELPDLQMGDGYTQIAYNPMDAESVKMVVQYYRKKLSGKAEDIDLEQYMSMAGRSGEELLDELAKKGYTEQMHIEQLEELQQRVQDKEYIPISLNIESLLLREDKDAYVLRVPRGRTGSKTEYSFAVKKSECILMDQGQTIITCLARNEKHNLYTVSSSKRFLEGKPVEISGEDFAKAFAPVENDRLREISKLKPEYIDIFPSFNQGQETEKKSSVPELVSEEKKKTKTLSNAEQTMKQVLTNEDWKERQESSEYIPLRFDVDTQLITDGPTTYGVNLPMESSENKEVVLCMLIDKTNARLSEDGKTLHAYLKGEQSSEIMEFNKLGEKVRDYKQSNEEISSMYLKNTQSKGLTAQSQKLEQVLSTKHIEMNIKL